MSKNNLSCKNIEAATLELLKKQKIQELTVEEICALADVSRRTFYNNFADKFAVVESIYYCFDKEFEELFADKKITFNDFIGFYDEIWKKYEYFYKNTLCYHGQNDANDVLKGLIIKYLYRIIEDQGYAKESLTKELQVAVTLFAIEAAYLASTTYPRQEGNVSKDEFIRDYRNYMPNYLIKYLFPED